MLRKSNFRFRVRVPVFSALFLNNLSEYNHMLPKKNNYLDYIFVIDSRWLKMQGWEMQE